MPYFRRGIEFWGYYDRNWLSSGHDCLPITGININDISPSKIVKNSPLEESKYSHYKVKLSKNEDKLKVSVKNYVIYDNNLYRQYLSCMVCRPMIKIKK